jgi:hypothetical protein
LRTSSPKRALNPAIRAPAGPTCPMFGSGMYGSIEVWSRTAPSTGSAKRQRRQTPINTASLGVAGLVARRPDTGALNRWRLRRCRTFGWRTAKPYLPMESLASVRPGGWQRVRAAQPTWLAERVGFEPTDLSINGFQDRRIRPLCHLSGRDCTAGFGGGRRVRPGWLQSRPAACTAEGRRGPRSSRPDVDTSRGWPRPCARARARSR